MERICSAISLVNWRKDFEALAKTGRVPTTIQPVKRGDLRQELVHGTGMSFSNDCVCPSAEGCVRCLKALSNVFLN